MIITKGWLKKKKRKNKVFGFGETLSDLKSTIRRNLGFLFTSTRTLGLLLLVRALALENANAILFYHSKNSLYHYTILFYNTSTSQNSISIKILFFNLSILLLSNRHFFPDTNGSTITNHHTTTTTPHHTSTSTAPPSSITTPPPKCFSLTASASHHTHYTIRKPKPISTGPQPLMNAEELMNPDTAD